MNKQALIEEAIVKIKQLPDHKIKEVNDFADFLLSRIDNQILLKNIQEITSKSASFDFLEEEEGLYDENDLKIKF